MNLLVAKTQALAEHEIRKRGFDKNEWKALGFGGALLGWRFDRIVVVSVYSDLTKQELAWKDKDLPLKLLPPGKVELLCERCCSSKNATVQD
jgi:hypothetical protein